MFFFFKSKKEEVYGMFGVSYNFDIFHSANIDVFCFEGGTLFDTKQI